MILGILQVVWSRLRIIAIVVFTAFPSISVELCSAIKKNFDSYYIHEYSTYKHIAHFTSQQDFDAIQSYSLYLKKVNIAS